MLSIRELGKQLQQRRKRADKMRARHFAQLAAGTICSAHHYGCKESQPHSHSDEGDVILTRV